MVAEDLPLSRFAHSLDDPIESVLATFLQSLRDRLVALLVGSVIQQSGDKMFQRELTVLIRTMFED